MGERSLGIAIAALLLAIAVSGCGGARDEGVKVTGSVTKGGAGLEGVLVVFAPRGGGNPKGARTEASGKFALRLPPGKYKVLLSKKVDVQGNVPPLEADLAELESNGLLHESLPAQYSTATASQLSADVPAAGTELAPFTVE